jgi:CheY-like chemotaxis protein
MGRILIFSELFEIREIIAEDFAAEGHTVVATGNPALITTLLMDLNPGMVLLDYHLNKVNPWKMMQVIRKKSPGTLVLPFAAYTSRGGNVRLVIPNQEGGENLSFQDFRQRMSILLNPQLAAGKGEPKELRLHPGS